MFYSVKYFHFRYRHEVVYYDRKLFLFGGGTGLTAHALDKVRKHSLSNDNLLLSLDQGSLVYIKLNSFTDRQKSFF